MPTLASARLLQSAALLLLCVLSGGCASTTEMAPLETLVAGSALHAPNGITFGPDGQLYAGSVASQTIYRIDPTTGAVAIVVPAPAGEADDVAFSPSGTLLWTALVAGEIRVLRPDQTMATLVSDFALINPLAFTTDGRLFAAQMAIDRLHEFPLDDNLQLSGEPRLVASKLGNLNSFEITADDQLIGPLFNNGEVAAVNIETGAVRVIARDLGRVVAVNLDAAGNVWAIDWASGALWRIDRKGDTWQAPRQVARLQPPLDNLAVGPDGAIYVSRPAHSAIDRIDPVSGEVRALVAGQLTAAGGLAITTHNGREVLLVADGYGYRLADTQDGSVSTTYDLTEFGFPAAASAAAANADYFALSDVVIRPSIYLIDRRNGKTVARWRDIRSALGILLTADGHPVITDYATGTLLVLNRADRDKRTVIARDLAGPVGLAWAGAKQDAVYVAEATSGSITRIELAADGERRTVASGLKQPEGLIVLADGRIAVVEVGTRRLVVVDPADGSIITLATDLPVGQQTANAPPPIYLPSGVAQAADGTLYISGDIDNSIRMLKN